MTARRDTNTYWHRTIKDEEFSNVRQDHGNHTILGVLLEWGVEEKKVTTKNDGEWVPLSPLA